MDNNFLKYFKTSEYDEKIIFKNGDKNYPVKEIKSLLLSNNIEDENLRLAINLIKKSINNDDIEFYTSGSTSDKRNCVKKTIQNLIIESNDLLEEFKLEGDLEFISTTTLEHLFGAEFHFVFPLNSGFMINLKRINYPEDLNIKNAVLITSPSFLETMRKYDVQIEVKPRYIFTAGAKLENETYEYAKSICSGDVIDIYGSSESGSIGYRKDYKSMRLKLFRGIKILALKDDCTEILTEYSKENHQIIKDRMELFGDEIELLGRSDRVLKVQEKRIDANVLESKIKENEYIDDCYCLEFAGKIATLVILNNLGKEFLLKNGSVELIKSLKNHLKTDFEKIPQKWKFFDEIPKNIRGKIDKEKIRELFELNLSLPLILSRIKEENSITFRLIFLGNSNFFKGHFEDLPILAGVVQLFYVDFFSKLAYNLDCHCGQIRRVKFANIIKPNQIIDLELTKTDTGISFKYKDENKTYSSGILPIKNDLLERI